MSSSVMPIPQESVYSRLSLALRAGKERIRAQKTFTVGDLVEALGTNSGPAVVTLLSVPFLWPLSLGPVTSPAAAVMLVIGLRTAAGYDTFPIKPKHLRVPIPHWVFRLMRRWVVSFARRGRWNQKHVHERPYSPARRKAAGYGTVAAAIMLALPIPLLPLTNTLPAIALVFFGLSMLMHSFRKLLYGYAFLALSVALFGALGVAIATIGIEGVKKVVGL